MQSTSMVITNIELGHLQPFKQGKVRSLYDLGDKLLLVASDRLSAFDHVFAEGIPYKGQVLTTISKYWFDLTKNIIKNHILSMNISDLPAEFQKYKDILNGRFMLVKKTKVVPIECIVRGYLEGSGWKDYQKTGTVCGHKLPAGLKQCSKLPEVIFTPSTKAEQGHDINITIEEMNQQIGKELGQKLMQTAIAVYKKAHDEALKKGIIIADTKFEMGLDNNGELLLIDEVLTPDSSRFWPADTYEPGHAQQSYDKQFIREYLESINWNKEPPIPHLPADVVQKTSQKYLEAYRRLTGKELQI